MAGSVTRVDDCLEELDISGETPGFSSRLATPNCPFRAPLSDRNLYTTSLARRIELRERHFDRGMHALVDLVDLGLLAITSSLLEHEPVGDCFVVLGGEGTDQVQESLVAALCFEHDLSDQAIG